MRISDWSSDVCSSDLAGSTDHNDHRNYLASIAYGRAFADGRGKLLLAGEIAQNSGIARQGDRDWGDQGWGIIANPAYTATNQEPRNLLVADARSANLSYGGVINRSDEHTSEIQSLMRI